MTTPDKPFATRALETALRNRFDGLDLTDEETRELWKTAANHQRALLVKEAAAEAAAMVEAPDFTPGIKSLADLRAEGDPPGSEPLIDSIATQDSTNLTVAPTNTGGSTLELNKAHALLTGTPFLGAFPVQGGPYEVVWLNPEEGEHTPRQRLDSMGLDEEASSYFHHVWTRDARFYFDQPHHVDRLAQSLADLDFDTPPIGRTRILIVDGFGPTLRGAAWNEGLEDWKTGIGEFRQAIGASTVFVRTQTTAEAARYLRKRKRDGTFPRTEMEHAVGFQLATWPDHRHIVSRDIGGRRILEVRGRVIGEHDFGYVWNPKTNLLKADMNDRLRAAMILAGDWQTDALYLKAQAADLDTGNKSAVSRWLGHRHDINSETFRKELAKWTYEANSGLWEPPKLGEGK